MRGNWKEVKTKELILKKGERKDIKYKIKKGEVIFEGKEVKQEDL